jgi:hypothetical protein
MPASLPHVAAVRSPGGHPQTVLSLESFARAGVVENDRLNCQIVFEFFHSGGQSGNVGHVIFFAPVLEERHYRRWRIPGLNRERNTRPAAALNNPQIDVEPGDQPRHRIDLIGALKKEVTLVRIDDHPREFQWLIESAYC